jgi:hypothetical protein
MAPNTIGSNRDNIFRFRSSGWGGYRETTTNGMMCNRMSDTTICERVMPYFAMSPRGYRVDINRPATMTPAAWGARALAWPMGARSISANAEVEVTVFI